MTVFTSIASYISHTGPADMIHSIAVYLGTLIGGITFTGSLVAFGKLQVRI